MEIMMHISNVVHFELMHLTDIRLSGYWCELEYFRYVQPRQMVWLDIWKCTLVWRQVCVLKEEEVLSSVVSVHSYSLGTSMAFTIRNSSCCIVVVLNSKDYDRRFHPQCFNVLFYVFSWINVGKKLKLSRTSCFNQINEVKYTCHHKHIDNTSSKSYNDWSYKEYAKRKVQRHE